MVSFNQLVLFAQGHSPQSLWRWKGIKGRKCINLCQTHVDSTDSTINFRRDTSAESESLYRFLEEEECEGAENLAVGRTVPTGLRGLFATESFETGEFLLALPFPSTLLVEERVLSAPSPCESETETETDVLEHELELGVSFLENFVSDAHWSAYIDCLPRVNHQSTFDATPDFWTVDSLSRLPVPKMRSRSLDRRHRVEEIARQKNYSVSDLQWAVWILRSRGFTSLKQTSKGLRERTILLPLIDMINHDGGNPNSLIEIIDTDIYEESFIALQAQRSIAKGEQITLRYGTGFETCLEFLDKYGFWPENNHNDARINWDLIDQKALFAHYDGKNSSDSTLAVVSRFCEHLRRQHP